MIIYNILYDVEEQLPNIFEHMMIIDWPWPLSSFIEGFCPNVNFNLICLQKTLRSLAHIINNVGSAEYSFPVLLKSSSIDFRSWESLSKVHWNTMSFWAVNGPLVTGKWRNCKSALLEIGRTRVEVPGRTEKLSFSHHLNSYWFTKDFYE